MRQLLAGYRIHVAELEGFEADDVIATLARQGAAAGVEACVVSGDKDLLQLVGERIWILNPWHGPPGRTTEKWYGLENAHERLGVPPERVVDYLALVGDTADNVPGVTGIGEKGALALVQKWGTVEAMLAHVDEIEPTRARNALLKHADEARLSKQLVTLQDTLPVALDLDAFTRQEPDWSALRDLFVELEFNSAARTAAAQLSGGAAVDEGAPARSGRATSADAARALPDTPPAVPREYRVADTPALVAEVIAAARAAGMFAFDTETMLDAD
ncbi:MAG: 5'-3' exonuclease H3TH domain-containing protein, partial [Gemmatimonadota bacterium]